MQGCIREETSRGAPLSAITSEVHAKVPLGWVSKGPGGFCETERDRNRNGKYEVCTP